MRDRGGLLGRPADRRVDRGVDWRVDRPMLWVADRAGWLALAVVAVLTTAASLAIAAIGGGAPASAPTPTTAAAPRAEAAAVAHAAATTAAVKLALLRYDEGDALAIPPETFVDAIDDPLARNGAAPDGPRFVDPVGLARALGSINAVGAVDGTPSSTATGGFSRSQPSGHGGGEATSGGSAGWWIAAIALVAGGLLGTGVLVWWVLAGRQRRAAATVDADQAAAAGSSAGAEPLGAGGAGLASMETLALVDATPGASHVAATTLSAGAAAPEPPEGG